MNKISERARQANDTTKASMIGGVGLFISIAAFLAVNYVNSSFSSSKDSVVVFQLIYALFVVVSLVGFVMTIVATVRGTEMFKKIVFAFAATITFLITGWLIIASVLVGAFTNF